MKRLRRTLMAVGLVVALIAAQSTVVAPSRDDEPVASRDAAPVVTAVHTVAN